MKRRLANSLLGIIEWLTGFSTNPSESFRLRVRLYLLREYERAVCQQISERVLPGMTAIDIGANIGYMARELARAVGPSGQVLAFEPNPLIFPILMRNVQRYPQVKVFPFAVGEQDGELTLRFSPNESGRASLFAIDGTATHSATVKICSLAQVLREAGLRQVDFLKIDIEGAELVALSTLQTDQTLLPATVIVEFNPACQRAAGRTPADFWNWFSSLGYVMRRIEESAVHPLRSLAELEVASAALPVDGSLDIVATRLATTFGGTAS